MTVAAAVLPVMLVLFKCWKGKHCSSARGAVLIYVTQDLQFYVFTHVSQINRCLQFVTGDQRCYRKVQAGRLLDGEAGKCLFTTVYVMNRHQEI